MPMPSGRSGSRPDYPSLFDQRQDGKLRDDLRWIPGLYRSAFERTAEAELHAELYYPGIFERLEKVHAMRRSEWPAWCWISIAEVATVLREEYADYTPRPGVRELGDEDPAAVIGLHEDAARLAAVAAWRHAGRHVVSVDRGMQQRFEHWPDSLPRGLEARWPALCVYAALQRSDGTAEDCDGAFVHLDWNVLDRRSDLRLVIDTGPETTFTTLRSMRGDHTLAHTDIRPWVGFTQFVASGIFHDAGALLGLAPGEIWPPSPRPGEESPMLWLASDGEG